VPYQGPVIGHHIVLNYIDSNGFHHTLQGVPEHRFDHNIDKLAAVSREEILSDGTNNRDSPFQRLRAAKAGKDSDVSLSQPYTMVAEGDDLSSRWALMQDFADEVNSIGYEYRPISQNSNSFAGGALQRGGFSDRELPFRKASIVSSCSTQLVEKLNLSTSLVLKSP
jgi:hypothetical protein